MKEHSHTTIAEAAKLVESFAGPLKITQVVLTLVEGESAGTLAEAHLSVRKVHRSE